MWALLTTTHYPMHKYMLMGFLRKRKYYFFTRLRITQPSPFLSDYLRKYIYLLDTCDVRVRNTCTFPPRRANIDTLSLCPSFFSSSCSTKNKLEIVWKVETGSKKKNLFPDYHYGSQTKKPDIIIISGYSFFSFSLYFSFTEKFTKIKSTKNLMLWLR